MGGSPGPATIRLNRVKQGEPDAPAELVPLVYKELRRLAGPERTGWQSRVQFLAIGALGVPPRTVKRNWSVAKGWLHAQLYGGPLE